MHREKTTPVIEQYTLWQIFVIWLGAGVPIWLLGWVAYPSGYFNASLAPYWIVTMWMLFATTLNSSMRWLKGRRLLAAVLGAVAGPLSYLAGQRLGGMEFVEPRAALAFLAVGWAAVMPLVVTLAERLAGFRVVAVRVGNER